MEMYYKNLYFINYNILQVYKIKRIEFDSEIIIT